MVRLDHDSSCRRLKSIGAEVEAVGAMACLQRMSERAAVTFEGIVSVRAGSGSSIHPLGLKVSAANTGCKFGLTRRGL
jgi:hypothetical protein